MTNLNEKKARLDELNDAIRTASLDIERCVTSSYHTLKYTYSGFCIVNEAGRVGFSRNGARIYAIPSNDGAPYLVFHGGTTDETLYFGKLPRTVRETIRAMWDARDRLEKLHAEVNALESEIEAEENDELPPPPATIVIDDATPAEPVRRRVTLKISKDAPMIECPISRPVLPSDDDDLEEYSYAAALRSTLAERVTERAQMAAGELPPFTPETMGECDQDLIDDLNEALEEIDASKMAALLEHADASEKYDRPAKAHCYREVAQLAALYAINDAIESQPELEDLLSALFDWSNPVQLPENIAAGVADALTTAREVFSVSLLSPNDLSERSRCWSTDNWSDVTEFFRPADDDRVSAFSLNPNCGVWISYFNSVWIFEADYVTDAIAGSFESQTRQFVETLSRYLGPDADDL